MAEKDPYVVSGLVRGLSVLKSFTPQRSEQGLAEISRTLGITRSAAFRTVHTLVSEGYLLKVPNQPRYRLGPQVLGLSYGYLASRELLEVAQKPLESLRDALDWSAHLGVLDGRHVLYLIRYPSSDGLSSLVHVGSRLPARQTAMGRLLLAQKSEAEIRRLLIDRPAQEVASTLANCDRDLKSETVVHEGQFESGLCSVAAPIRDMSDAVVATISVTKANGAAEDLIQTQVLNAARAIARGLGVTG